MSTHPVPRLIGLDSLDGLLGELRGRGFGVVGPSVEDGVIRFGPLASVAELPIGWTDSQDAGQYQAVLDQAVHERDGGPWVFGFASATNSPKQFLFPPREAAVHAIRTPAGEVAFAEPTRDEPPLALVGVRACDLHAIAILDRVLLGGDHEDAAYRARRERGFIIAVECSHPSGTCFCASMDAGPSIAGDTSTAARCADIVLTELPPTDAAEHRFVLRAESMVARELVAALDLDAATDADVATGAGIVGAARGRMGRQVDVGGLHDLLLADAEHLAWGAVAARCLSCTNCTLVCPTCFCTSTAEMSTLGGDEASRWREWDSCFSLSFSFLHGGSVRTTTRSRYRQWATHKLATWEDQFGTSGCVGCGRCITWCPAGIDLTAHVRALATDPNGSHTLLGAALAEGMSS